LADVVQAILQSIVHRHTSLLNVDNAPGPQPVQFVVPPHVVGCTGDLVGVRPRANAANEIATALKLDMSDMSDKLPAFATGRWDRLNNMSYRVYPSTSFLPPYL
jgi:hypothetical protein